jgi:hypothetical protein
MKSYYRLTKSLDQNYGFVTKMTLPDTADGRTSSVLAGKKITVPVPNPLTFDVGYLNGADPHHYNEGAGFIIISDLFLQALQKAGVDNFQLFPAVLRDIKKKQRTWNNYYAFNEIGLLDAALLSKCEYEVISEGDGTEASPGIYGFLSVVLSAKKLKHEPKMFRLPQQAFDQLYISEDVKTVLQEMSPPEKFGMAVEKTEVK